MRAVSAVVVAIVAASCGDRGPTETIRVTIPQGATVSTAAESLSVRRVIRSPRFFVLLARVTGRDRSLQAGVYELTTGMSASDALNALVSGRTALDRLVIPEGLMLSEIAPSVERQLGIPADSFRAAAHDSGLIERVGARGPTLEGYLYPSTYFVRVGATATEVVRQMVAEFESRWQPEWNQRLEEFGFTRDEAVTLASIVEGEARHPEDLKYVSSVYHNRLERGMRLQADPTVIYALGVRRRLFSRDYEIDSPYNTYRIDGLPPHPISQPSSASIEATLYPRQSDFYYFVADAEGRHVFSRTYREHLTAIRRIRDPD